MNQKKVSLRPLGVVAAGADEQSAVRNYLRLKSKDTAVVEAAMYGIDLAGGSVGHFLVSTASVTAPFSPLSGEQSARKFKMGASAEAVASVVEYFGATDRAQLMQAYASADTAPKLFVATCSTCTHVSASDTKTLLRHCTLCGDDLPQDDEGTEDIGLDITDGGDGSDDGSGDGGDGSEPLTDAQGRLIDEDGYLIDEDGNYVDENGDPVDEPVMGDVSDDTSGGGDGGNAVDDETGGSGSGDDQNSTDASDKQVKEVPLVSEDPQLEENGSGTSESSNEPAVQAAIAAAQQARAAAAQQSKANAETTPAPAGETPNNEPNHPSSGQPGASTNETNNGSDKSSDGVGSGAGDAPAGGENAAGTDKPTGKNDNDAPPIPATAHTQPELGEDSVITVSTLEDVVASDATPGNTATRLIYIPGSQGGAEAQWMATVNNVPAATVTASQAAKASPQLAAKFHEQAYASAVLALCSQAGVQNGLKELGFESYAFDLPIKSIVEAKVQKVEATANDKVEQAVAEVAEGIQAALSASWVAHAKNFFAEDSNELKAAIFDALSSAGVMNAAEMTESVFANSGEAFGRSLISRAFDFLQMPVEARNQLVAAITKANTNMPSENNVSVAAAVADQLGNLGTSTASTQEPPVKAGGALNSAQQIRNVVASIRGPQRGQ